MAKSQFQKAKLLYILDMLRENTDEEHAISTKEMIEHLEVYGIHADRKTIYSDIEELVNMGLDILKRDSRTGGGYYMASREFELAELKLLVDAVQATRFITPKKSRELIHKLEKLTSKYEAVQLQRQVYVAGRSKAENESIYYNVDAIHKAIQNDVQLEFIYLMWTPEKKLVPRREKQSYKVSPWALLWQDENYYLAAFDEDAGMIKHYRVDKMGGVKVLDSRRAGKEIYEQLDVAQYSSQTFGMFGGEKVLVTLQMKNELAGVMIDRFGKDIPIRKRDENTFTVRLTVSISQQFYGWLAGLGPAAWIVAPTEAVEGYRNYLLTNLQHYKPIG